MLKRLRTAHPIVFCVLAEVVFLASLFVTDLIFTIVLVLFRADFSALDTYLYSTLQELVGALVSVLLYLPRTKGIPKISAYCAQSPKLPRL